MHLCIGLIVFSNSNIIPDKGLDYVKKFQQFFDSDVMINFDRNIEDDYFKRFANGVGFLYFVFACLVVAQLLIRTVFNNIIQKILLFLYYMLIGGKKGIKT